MKPGLAKQRLPSAQPAKAYDKFEEINGTHPWQKAIPDSYVSYPVKTLQQGKVTYFNFELAKEMGLISSVHRHTLNKELEKKILETFAIRIINEFDQKKGVKTDFKKPNPYMATRYLQLQHSNKQGKTSGDGRSIWNGMIEHKGQLWDISSRGTGVTCLAPGAVKAGRALETGSTDFGYGCGLAELDELYSCIIMSESLHSLGINTERVLTVIDLGNGVGVGVRAGKNLMRPAHLFLYLKQENYEVLLKSWNYLIQRQIANKVWPASFESPKNWNLALSSLSEQFAKFSAQLERHHIFTWMDWDGDNVLADAGIIDYGSIRRFGLRHDGYRYDDIERFSTNLNEQKNKARQIVQVFCQIVDFLQTKKRKSIKSFLSHSALKEFDQKFASTCLDIFKTQMGLPELNWGKRQQKAIAHFYTCSLRVEKSKASHRQIKVLDGITKVPLYRLSRILEETLSQYLEKKTNLKKLHRYGLNSDLKSGLRSLTSRREKLLIEFTKSLSQMVKTLALTETQIQKMHSHALTQNTQPFLTGNAAEMVTQSIMEISKKRGSDQIQKLMDLVVGHCSSPVKKSGPLFALDASLEKDFQSLMQIVQDYADDI